MPNAESSFRILLLVSMFTLGAWTMDRHWVAAPVPTVACQVPPPAPRTAAEVRDSLVVYWAERFDIPPTLALAVAYVENPRADSLAISSAGAIGLMQVMPTIWGRTAALLCQQDETLFSRDCNVQVGMFVLAHYLDEHGGDVDRALRAYNGALYYRTAGNAYTTAVYAAQAGLEALGPKGE